MELKNLDTFIQVAELSSFTKAADKLGYSQSTVSFQIKQLETELNAQLFERINHTVSITERGKEVLRYAHQISKLTRDMESTTTSGHELSGLIRIAMADSLCSWLMKETFHDFHQEFPGITLKIIAASTEEMFRLLNQNEVDLVYTLDNHIYDKNYVIQSEEKMQAHFVASTKFLQDLHFTLGASTAIENPQLTAENLARLPFILTEKRMSYRRLMDERMASMSLEISPLLEIGNTDLICNLIEQNMGLSFLPDYVTEKAVSEGKMVRLQMDNFEIDIWKQLLYHKDKWVSPQMQIVMDYLSQIHM